MALAIAVSACQKSSPTRPTDAAAAGATTGSVTDAKLGITITTPIAVSPTDGTTFKYTDQPVTLTIKNAAATGSGTNTYTFQVATDAGFSSVVQTKDSVAEGSGQTAVKLDTLPGPQAKDYFWRARANNGGVAGPFSKGLKFSVGPQVVIQAPTPVSPANGGQASGAQPTLTVNNASITGPVGNVRYTFQISDSSSFGNVLGSATVSQGSGQTSASIDVKLATNGTYFWRAQATDTTNNVTGPFSAVQSFKYVPFDMSQAIIVDSPSDLASWPVTTQITSVTFTGDAFEVDFDRRQGPNKWPEFVPPGWSGGLQYTLGMCVNKDAKQWYCSGVVQFWDGRSLDDTTPPSYVGRNWFYDSRWGPILGYQPADGETVGLFVGSGNLRDGTSFTQASCPRICERSNVAMVTWQNDGFKQYVFSLARSLASVIRR
ncbi:MAG TPA: hypothetical protein VFA59_25405 [Vicinamibacterales bacterium]|nr:hypothetical protein [Vicinamibacterales bacterium]